MHKYQAGVKEISGVQSVRTCDLSGGTCTATTMLHTMQLPSCMPCCSSWMMLSSVPDSMSRVKGMYGGTLPSACGGACIYTRPMWNSCGSDGNMETAKPELEPALPVASVVMADAENWNCHWQLCCTSNCWVGACIGRGEGDMDA